MIDVKTTNTPYPAWEGIESFLGDDSFTVPEGPFVSVFDDDKMAASFTVTPWSEYCYQIHGGVAKKFWGRGAEICVALGMFLFRGTPCVKIVAVVPEYNRLMRKCLLKSGLLEEGRIKKSFFKNMRLHDQIIYGVERGRIIKCQQQ